MHYLMGRYGVSQRRAARAARFRRSSLRYESRRDPFTVLRHRLRELAQARVRFGYRRLLVLMHREGWEVGKHRFYREYTEEGLDPEGHQAPRPSGRAGDEVRACDQPQDGQSPRPDDSSLSACPGRSGDRVVERRAFLGAMTGGLLAAPLAA